MDQKLLILNKIADSNQQLGETDFVLQENNVDDFFIDINNIFFQKITVVQLENIGIIIFNY